MNNVNPSYIILLRRTAGFLLRNVYIIAAMLILFLSLRGHLGSPNDLNLNSPYWTDNGPFELSPERGRFALTYSLLEHNSFFFPATVARFAVPDLGYSNGKYVSLFAPGISYIVMPGYVIGKMLGSSQVGAYAVIAVFALLNLFLIQRISITLGLNPVAAILGALAFLFATPGYDYAVNLYQHHISSFLILLSLYLLLKSKSFLSLVTVWFLLAMSIPIDYPNLLLMAPIGVLAISRGINISETVSSYHVHFKTAKLFSLIGIILPLVFFLWFNKQSYNNPLQFSGTVAGVKNIDTSGKPAGSNSGGTRTLERAFNPEIQHKSALNFFNSRYLVNGLYLQFLSPDRGILVFTPVMFLGFIGAWMLYRKNRQFGVTVLSIMLITVLVYALWGDPWGGWAFGSRYLIPLYALAGIGIAAFLDRWRKNYFIIGLFLLLFGYSVIVNTSGALSSSANPPQVEALSLEKLSGRQQRYSFDRNIFELQQGESKSLMFDSVFRQYISAFRYFELITVSILILSIFYIYKLMRSDNKIK